MNSLSIDSGRQGFVLLEVMMALIVLSFGVIVVTQSYRSSLQMGRQGREMYAATLIIEGRILELERTGRMDNLLEQDPTLGPISWNEEIKETEYSDWKEHRLTMSWGVAKNHNELQLSTFLTQ